MTVGELRKALEGIADDMAIGCWASADDRDESVCGGLRKATVHFGCAETAAMMLTFDEDEDDSPYEMDE